jgi:hypothetical protein
MKKQHCEVKDRCQSLTIIKRNRAPRSAGKKHSRNYLTVPVIEFLSVISGDIVFKAEFLPVFITAEFLAVSVLTIPELLFLNITGSVIF